MGKVVKFRRPDEDEDEQTSDSFFAKTKRSAKQVVKKKAKVKDEVEIEGISDYAALIAIAKAIESACGTIRSEVVEAMTDYFVAEGIDKGKRPDNINGIDGKQGEASLEMRKRSSRSGLNDLEIKLLKKHKIPTEEVADSEATWIINPKYMHNEELLSRVDKALKSVKGIPRDFIEYQDPPSLTVVTDESIDEVFQKDVKTAKLLLPIVATFAIKAKWKGEISQAFKRAMNLIHDDD